MWRDKKYKNTFSLELKCHNCDGGLLHIVSVKRKLGVDELTLGCDKCKTLFRAILPKRRW